eukprot:TRINITY_DN33911_c0_g1_i1.p1 TRINITY_DN33911_c0_g1~~TRINITY_DN33911_c0_g1_i1.p1  ORF type:complete len:412 (+),score=83.78 TRINITY_DN33911_c0_g1_i1:67-1236(+)
MPLQCSVVPHAEPPQSTVILLCVLLQLPQWPALWRWSLGSGERSAVRVPTSSGTERTVELTGLSERRPSLFIVDDFLEPSEVTTLLGAVQYTRPARLHRQGDQSPPTADETPQAWQWRSGRTATFPTRGATVDAISRRLSVLLRLPFAAMRNATLQVVSYEPSEHYYPHYDSREFAELAFHSDGGQGEGYPYSQRYVTVLLFLTDTETGGDTVFPWAGVAEPPFGLSAATDIAHPESALLWRRYCALPAAARGGLSVSPRRGRAAVFYSHVPGTGERLGKMDPWSLHAGCDVGPGSHKALANYWVHVRPWDAAGALLGMVPGAAEGPLIRAQTWMRETREGAAARAALAAEAEEHLLRRRAPSGASAWSRLPGARRLRRAVLHDAPCPR